MIPGKLLFARCFFIVSVASLTIFSCKAPPLLFKPMVIDRHRLDSVFQTAHSDMVVFQTVNNKNDRRGKKRNYYQLAAYALTGGRFDLLNQNTFFQKRKVKPPFVPIAIGKEGLTSNFGNLILQPSTLPADKFPDLRFILLYPEMLETNSAYVKYVLYYAETPDEIPGKPKEISTMARSIEPADAAINPSPPR